MAGHGAPLLHLPKSKSIDIEFENIVYTVRDGRKGKFVDIF